MTEKDKPPKARATRDPLTTIRRILDAAREEFGANGFDGTRVEHIARRAKVSKQIIYFYFKGKDELYWELLKDIAINTNERLLKIDYNAPPDIAVRNYIEAVYDAFADDPLIGMMSLDQSIHDGAQLRSTNEIRQQQKVLNERMTDVVKRGKELGFFHEEMDDYKIEFMTVIITVGCLSSSQMLQRYSGRTWQESPEHTREFALDFIMRAIRK